MRFATRVATFLFGLLFASVLIFMAANALPGDVAAVLLGLQASEEDLAQLRRELGLERPLLVRYLEWATGLLRGDLGQSLLSGTSINSVVAQRLSVTAWVTLFGMFFAIIIAVPLGSFAALRRRRWGGFAASALSQIGLSIPAFWLGILLVMFFAVKLRILPAGGYVALGDGMFSWIKHLVLPVASLAIVQSSLLSRYVRAAVIDVYHEDYFRTARSLGWSIWGALIRHGTRNIALSLITVVGLQLGTLLTGAIIIEHVFALPGLGSLLLNAVSQRDLGLVQGIVFLLVCAVLTINLIIELTYVAIDPRLRERRSI